MRLRYYSFFLLTFCLTGIPGTSAATLFITAPTYPAAATPMAIVAADLNRDGTLDVVTANGGTVSVFLGHGNGTFDPSVDYAAGGTSLAVGDLNGDGFVDVATAGISILLGNGDGTLRPRADLGFTASSVALGDWNGDGTLDIATVNGQELWIFQGSGDGTFPTRTTYAATGASVVTTLDANVDGKPDVAAAGFDGGVQVFLGGGDGTFGAPAVYLRARLAKARMLRRARESWGGNDISIAASDLNGDGKADLAVSANEGPVMVLLGTGDGTFPTVADYPVPMTASGLTIGDVTGDGRTDIVTANDFTGTVTVLSGPGDGTFPARQDYGIPAIAVAPAVGDFNGDGRLDVVATGLGSIS
ncbi:MAG TPA: VCBS repeat-containing protein, partial [Candidatus Saccharimonadales bacterium]|nr:VCBS repeat-containing protein [Candidatus Saccharimonadales bacterium]